MRGLLKRRARGRLTCMDVAQETTWSHGFFQAAAETFWAQQGRWGDGLLWIMARAAAMAVAEGRHGGHREGKALAAARA